MSAEAVQSYLEARRAMNTAQVQIERYVAVVSQTSNSLANWRTCRISGLPVEPHSTVSASTNTVDGSLWPTAVEVAEALNAWHNAEANAKAAWEQIGPDERHGLMPPA